MERSDQSGFASIEGFGVPVDPRPALELGPINVVVAPNGCGKTNLYRSLYLLALLHMPTPTRPLDARELSDGTLRYLCLLAALLSPRPPPLLALNEPETSLHPDLLFALAGLLAAASKNSQLWVTTLSSASDAE